MTKNTWQCLKISGFLGEKEDVELKFLLFLEDKTLGEITDIEYFKKKLYRSLNVPPSEWMAKVDLIWVDLLKSSETN